MKGKNKRAHERVSAFLPFQVRRLLPHECSGLKCHLSLGGIVIENALPPLVSDERLNLWLNMLNAKIDYLISISSPQREKIVSMDFEPLTISCGGMSLIAKERFDKGDVLETRIILQVYPAKVLILYGNVVRIETTLNKSETYTVGVQFLDMDDTVREEILNVNFKKIIRRNNI